jgi:hypothetical protein
MNRAMSRKIVKTSADALPDRPMALTELDRKTQSNNLSFVATWFSGCDKGAEQDVMRGMTA